MRRIILAFLLLLPVWGLIAQDNEGLTPMDVAKIQSVVDIDLSDDAKMLAFVRSVPADPLKENKPSSYHLYVYNVAMVAEA